MFLLLLFVLHKNLGDCSFKTHHSVTYYRRLQEENSLVGLSRAAISARPLNLHKPTKLLPFSATRGGKRKWNGFWMICLWSLSAKVQSAGFGRLVISWPTLSRAPKSTMGSRCANDSRGTSGSKLQVVSMRSFSCWYSHRLVSVPLFFEQLFFFPRDFSNGKLSRFPWGQPAATAYGAVFSPVIHRALSDMD